MPTIHEMIVRPLITEKSSAAYQDRGEYTFEVHPKASKPQIRAAIEQLFGVHVETVWTSNHRGKVKRLGKTADISDGKPAVEPAAPKIPFRTKSKLRYLFWGSAVSAAVVLGKVATERKRSGKPATKGKGHGQDNGNQDAQTPGSS